MKHIRTIGITVAAFLLVAGLGFSESGDVPTKAFQLRLQGKTDEALKLLEEDLAANPGHAQGYFELARTHFYLLDFKAVETAIDQAVAIAPDQAEYHYFAGMSAAYSVIDAAHHDDQDRMKKCQGKAISELEAAVKLDPDYHDARFFLVILMSEMGEEIEVEASVVEGHVLILEEKDPIWGAKARSNLVDEKQKRVLWDNLLAEQGDNAQACYEAGSAFIDLGDLDRATECINKAIELDPERTHILLRLGNAYVMSNDLAKAAVNVERYLGFDHPVPLRAWALATLGRIRQRMGNADEGQVMIDQALALDPHLWKTFMPPPEELFTEL